MTYVDNDWSNVCSPNIADYNFKNRIWCSIQKDDEKNCQSAYWKENQVSFENGFPCHDYISKRELSSMLDIITVQNIITNQDDV